MWAQPDNIGDGHIICGSKQPDDGQVYIGDASTQRLDDLVAEPVHVMKIDVEGFEGQVLSGASRLLSAGKVQWLVLECVSEYIASKGGDPGVLLANLIAYGFDCQCLGAEDLQGRKSPGDWSYWSPTELLKLSKSAGADIYCRRNREPLQPVLPWAVL